jgi:hypothetical protein
MRSVRRDGGQLESQLGGLACSILHLTVAMSYLRTSLSKYLLREIENNPDNYVYGNGWRALLTE